MMASAIETVTRPISARAALRETVIQTRRLVDHYALRRGSMAGLDQAAVIGQAITAALKDLLQNLAAASATPADAVVVAIAARHAGPQQAHRQGGKGTDKDTTDSGITGRLALIGEQARVAARTAGDDNVRDAMQQVAGFEKAKAEREAAGVTADDDAPAEDDTALTWQASGTASGKGASGKTARPKPQRKRKPVPQDDEAEMQGMER